MTIPEGAIKKGCVEELYMAVCRDDKDRPRLHGMSLLLQYLRLTQLHWF